MSMTKTRNDRRDATRDRRPAAPCKECKATQKRSNRRTAAMACRTLTKEY